LVLKTKRFVLVGIAVTLVLAVVFASGPRQSLVYGLRDVALPQDLDAYLHASEARVQDIRPGTEKTIVWADPATKRRTPLALVYLHGFSASRQEIVPVCDRLARQLGANLFYTRLTGHGRDSAAMAEVSVERLLQDTFEALAIGRRLGERVVVVGTSTGATLATWLIANGHDRDVAAAVMISPNLGLRDPMSELLLWPWGRQIAHLVVGPTWRWQPVNEKHGRFWTSEFPVSALLPMFGLVQLARTSDLEKVSVPVLVFYSPQDRIVDSGAVEKHFARFGSPAKRLIEIKEPGSAQRHVLAGDILSPGNTDHVVDRTIEFIAGLPAR